MSEEKEKTDCSKCHKSWTKVPKNQLPPGWGKGLGGEIYCPHCVSEGGITIIEIVA